MKDFDVYLYSDETRRYELVPATGQRWKSKKVGVRRLSKGYYSISDLVTGMKFVNVFTDFANAKEIALKIETEMPDVEIWANLFRWNCIRTPQLGGGESIEWRLKEDIDSEDYKKLAIRVKEMMTNSDISWR